jgi:hypothetical protein
MKVSCVLVLTLILSSCLPIRQPISTSVENPQTQFDESKYFQMIESIMINKLKESNIEINNISNRSESNNAINILIIPQFIIKNDTSIKIILDSANPINRTILFDKNKIIGSLLFTENNDTIFCSTKLNGQTPFDCGKYIHREVNYYNALKALLKKKPTFIFKSSNFERVWFYIDKKNNIRVFTYDLEDYLLRDFFNKENLKKYSISESTIIK